MIGGSDDEDGWRRGEERELVDQIKKIKWKLEKRRDRIIDSIDDVDRW